MKKSIIKAIFVCSFFLTFSTCQLLAQHPGRGNISPKPPKDHHGITKGNTQQSAPLDRGVIAMVAAGVALGFLRNNKRLKVQ